MQEVALVNRREEQHCGNDGEPGDARFEQQRGRGVETAGRDEPDSNGHDARGDPTGRDPEQTRRVEHQCVERPDGLRIVIDPRHRKVDHLVREGQHAGLIDVQFFAHEERRPAPRQQCQRGHAEERERSPARTQPAWKDS